MKPANVAAFTPRPPARQPLPEHVIEALAELWCEALLANLRRHPIEASQTPPALSDAA